MATSTRTALGVCNLCEAICGLELTIEDRPGPRSPPSAATTHDPLSRGYICPKGVALADVHDDPDRLRRRRSATGRRRRGRRSAGTRRSTWSPTGSPRAVNEHGRDAVGDLPRQPQRALARLRDPRRGDREEPAHPQQVQRQLGRPDPAPVRGLAALRPPAADPDPRHRPDVLLPGLRRQPDGLQRLADDRAGLPAAAARPQGARRPDGRVRPAPHRDRQGRRRAPLRAARHRRGRAAGDAARAVRGGADHPPSYVDGVDRVAARRRRLHPGARRGGQRRPGRR